MGQSNRITVDLYPRDEADASAVDPIIFEDVNFVSFVSDDTYGIPAVIGDPDAKRHGLPLRVLYVNTGAVLAVDVTRSN